MYVQWESIKGRRFMKCARRIARQDFKESVELVHSETRKGRGCIELHSEKNRVECLEGELCATLHSANRESDNSCVQQEGNKISKRFLSRVKFGHSLLLRRC